jgi:adenylate cyclase
MVSSYTLAASQLLVRYGGTIVDFNGDGMMAVFGALADAPEKEQAAVQAAQELVHSMRDQLPSAILAPVRTPIGIGVATGTAYVGCVRSAEREFWTALGAVTNRAARLQALTRDLNCDMLIDEVTFSRLNGLQAEFKLHPHVSLRGHVQRMNLYSTIESDSAQLVVAG